MEYRPRIPTVNFLNRVFWIGELLGNLVGTESHLSFGWQGAVDVVTACAVSVPRGFVPSFFRNLNPMTRTATQLPCPCMSVVCTVVALSGEGRAFVCSKIRKAPCPRSVG